MCTLPNYSETDLAKHKQSREKETVEVILPEQLLLKNSI